MKTIMSLLQRNKGLLNVIGWAIVLFVLIFNNPSPTQSVDLSRRDKKTIVKNIHNKEKVIEHYTTEVYNKLEVAKMLDGFKKNLMQQLEDAKNSRDTLLIVHLQDTVINKQEEEIKVRDSIISDQFVIIDAKSSIIGSKDTLILDLQHDLKKVKRQRNISLIVNAVQTGIIIFK